MQFRKNKEVRVERNLKEVGQKRPGAPPCIRWQVCFFFWGFLASMVWKFMRIRLMHGSGEEFFELSIHEMVLILKRNLNYWF